MLRRALLVGLLVLSTAACEEKKPEVTAPSATAAAAAPTASASQSPPAPSGSAKAKGKMTNCPNAVEGSKTEIQNTPKGVEITVLAKDEAATKEIRARAAHLAEASKDTAQMAKHNGTGQGGGQFGRCPVVMKDTTVTTADVEGGSKITVDAKESSEVDWLQREARERQAGLGMPGADGAGAGKMAHCPSAVRGAMTVVKDSKDGALVTITAKEEAAIADVRERAKHIVEAAKKDPKDVKHDGDGDGGGSLGRCPIVLKETKITSKEIPGGVEIDVVPEKKTDLAEVRKEAKERAEKFMPPSGSAGAEPAGKKGKH